MKKVDPAMYGEASRGLAGGEGLHRRPGGDNAGMRGIFRVRCPEMYLGTLAGAGLTLALVATSNGVLGALCAMVTAYNAWSVQRLRWGVSESLKQRRKLLACHAEMAALKAQLEPHFLYNTLACVQALIRRDADGADLMLSDLAKYMRYASGTNELDMSDLGTEFEVADAYLRIAKRRMGKRLKVTVELDDALHGVSVPKLALHVLVVNAITHGAEPKVGPVEVAVRATLKEDMLTVSVVDDGAGLSADSLVGCLGGLGNLAGRLSLMYGDQGSLEVVEAAGGGVAATLRIPASPVGSQWREPGMVM